MTKVAYALALHGGAGTINPDELTTERESDYRDALLFALAQGEIILSKGGRAIDAVEATVCALEDNPLFNAGKGAVFTHDEKHEMDAAIMEGNTLGAGAVAGIYGVRNPISMARAVMEKTEHVLLAGPQALKFAKEVGIKLEADDYFFTQHRLDQLRKIRSSGQTALDHNISAPKMGTVGAVALDQLGHLAAATSTGGMTNKRHGRVGDSPLIGCGTYANNATCAVSCTGHGEFFIKAVAAFDVHALMMYKKLSLMEAAEMVIMHKLPAMGGEGGLIAVDTAGNIAMPFNSTGMYRASVCAGHQASWAIFR